MPKLRKKREGGRVAGERGRGRRERGRERDFFYFNSFISKLRDFHEFLFITYFSVTSLKWQEAT